MAIFKSSQPATRQSSYGSSFSAKSVTALCLESWYVNPSSSSRFRTRLNNVLAVPASTENTVLRSRGIRLMSSTALLESGTVLGSPFLVSGKWAVCLFKSTLAHSSPQTSPSLMAVCRDNKNITPTCCVAVSMSSPFATLKPVDMACISSSVSSLSRALAGSGISSPSHGYASIHFHLNDFLTTVLSRLSSRITDPLLIRDNDRSLKSSASSSVKSNNGILAIGSRWNLVNLTFSQRAPFFLGDTSLAYRSKASLTVRPLSMPDLRSSSASRVSIHSTASGLLGNRFESRAPQTYTSTRQTTPLLFLMRLIVPTAASGVNCSVIERNLCCSVHRFRMSTNNISLYCSAVQLCAFIVNYVYGSRLRHTAISCKPLVDPFSRDERRNRGVIHNPFIVNHSSGQTSRESEWSLCRLSNSTGLILAVIHQLNQRLSSVLRDCRLKKDAALVRLIERFSQPAQNVLCDTGWLVRASKKAKRMTTMVFGWSRILPLMGWLFIGCHKASSDPYCLDLAQ